jgi:hypothetical protein
MLVNKTRITATESSSTTAQATGTSTGRPSLAITNKLGKPKGLHEEAVPGDGECTRPCQNHNDHGKKATKRISTIKLPDHQHTQTGSETLRQLFRIHFQDCRLTDESEERQGQPNLGMHRCKLRPQLLRGVINPKSEGLKVPLNYLHHQEQMRLYLCSCSTG